jgi:hypothetical protein
MLQAWSGVEAATRTFEGNDYGFTFPVPRMLLKHWKAGGVPAYLSESRRQYQQALDGARKALPRSSPAGRAYIEFWIGRLEFSVGYIQTVEAVRRAATAEARSQKEVVLTEAQSALASLREALEAYARIARNRTDLGAIAVVNEYGYRALKDKIEELRK